MELTTYFEFSTDRAPYYAIIAATVDTDDLRANPQHNAVALYEEQVSEMDDEDSAKHFGGYVIPKEQAFYKFAEGSRIYNDSITKVLNDFHSIKNGIVIIDGSLL